MKIKKIQRNQKKRLVVDHSNNFINYVKMNIFNKIITIIIDHYKD